MIELYVLKLWFENRGPVRGGSEGSIDPPRILENIIKELNIEFFELNVWHFDPPMDNSLYYDPPKWNS